ncbi:hypothetical protein ACHAWF_006876, partial [Thalassiosira exigua]
SAEDFAAAAIKIQTSAGIYHRKVDFLHATTYEALESFRVASRSNRAGGGKGGRASGDKRDPDVAAFEAHDPELEFLPLDDVLPAVINTVEGRRRIDLREEEPGARAGDAGGSNAADASLDATNLDRTSLNATNATGAPRESDGHAAEVTLLSLGGVLSATRIDDRTLDGAATSAAPVVDRTSLDGASPAAVSRMLLANLQGGRGGGGLGGGGDGGGGCGGGSGGGGEGALRILGNACDVDPRTGALLMPGTRATAFVDGEAQRSEEEVEIFPGGLSGDDDECGAGGDSFGAVGESFGDAGGGDWGGDDGDDDGGVGFQLADDPADDALDADASNVEEKEDEGAPSNPRSDAKPTTEPTEGSEEPPDPWGTLDPHAPSSAPGDRPRPLRIDCTVRLPLGIDDDDRPSRAVTGSRTRRRKRTKEDEKKRGKKDGKDHEDDWLRSPFLLDVLVGDLLQVDDDDDNTEGSDAEEDDDDGRPKKSDRRLARVLRLLDGLKKDEPLFGSEFAYVAKAHARHREAVRRRRRMRHREGADEDGGPMETWNVGGAISGGWDAEADAAADFDGGDGVGPVDFGGGYDFGDDDDDRSFGRDVGHYAGDENDDPTVRRSNVDFDVIDDAYAFGGGGGAFDHDPDDVDLAGRTFEDLCRAHLRRFAKRAEAYAAETKLSRRVGRWQEGLVPLLEERERRPEFDIHGCGRGILRTASRRRSSTSCKRGKRTSAGEPKVASDGAEEDDVEKGVVRFATIVGPDREEYEVCRLFLATLALCDAGNVALRCGRDGDAVSDPKAFEVEVLDATFRTRTERYPGVQGEEERGETMSDLEEVDEDGSS